MKEAETLDESKYTAESWSVYALAIAAGGELLKDSSAAPAQIQSEIDRITAAKAGLKEKVNNPGGQNPGSNGNNQNQGSSNNGSKGNQSVKISSKSKSTAVKTGDQSQAAIWGMLMVLMGFVILKYKKK